MNFEHNILPHSGEVHLIKSYYPKDSAEIIFESLRNETPWENHQITVYGKKYPQPRLSAYYGDGSYLYSQTLFEPLPWTPLLKSLQEDVSHIAAVPFNSCLLNYYRCGRDSMGLHSDSEKSLGRNPIIASISFGATRKFSLIHNETKEKITLILDNGDLLIMGGSSQHQWKHAVPTEKKIKSGRINLTFRRIYYA